MVSYQMPLNYPSINLKVETDTHNFFDNQDAGIQEDIHFDQNTLDSGLELSPPIANSRRNSFSGASFWSPKLGDFQAIDMQSLPSNNPFEPQSNNPFMRMDQHQANNWRFSGSGTATPHQGFANVPIDFDPNAPLFDKSTPTQIPFTNPAGMVNPFTNNQVASVGSVHSQSMNKRPRAQSPVGRSHNELRRGDGIRKKNARFEIPAERNLNNIDQLIAQSTDDGELKELKQQKRLLRNRQAALDSRQRKKMHTERLEDEKKHYTVVISDLEEDNNALKAQLQELQREKQGFAEHVQYLLADKDQMIRDHTLETGQLRKKVDVLQQEVQRLSIGTSSMSSDGMAANNFTDPFPGTDDMTMPGSWDVPGYFSNYTMDPEVEQPDMTMVPSKPEPPVENEKSSPQGGLLFLLFLVGAFVMSSRSTPSIPRVSEDVRVASETLLNNVLKDAGIGSQSTSTLAMAPQPSGSGNAAPESNNAGSGGPSALEQFSESLIRPTQEQTNDQVFSLSAAQYNGVSDHNYLPSATEKSVSQGRKNLADALVAMRTNTKENGAADVYTRSLLWDQIPSEVVRNFANMFAEHSEATL